MSGSRLGRGRSGRLAVYGGCGVVVVLLIFLYRAATSEMARLRELHVQCAHQHEALAAQLQVIFEYKVRLEKSLAEEKSANAAAKQALQQRANEEKSRHEKDNETMQKFKSLQQSYNILQSNHQDLQGDLKSKEKQYMEETEKLRLNFTKSLKEMDVKKQEYDRFKEKYLALEMDNGRLQEKNEQLQQNTSKTGSTIEHLNKKIFQLTRELDVCKRYCKKEDVIVQHLEPETLKDTERWEQQDKLNEQVVQRQESPGKSLENAAASPVEPAQQQQSPPQQQQQQQQQQRQQVSRPNTEDENPQPLHAPVRDRHAIGDALSNEEGLTNDQVSNVRFAQRDGNVVPIGPNELLPLPYKLSEKNAGREQEGEELEEEGEFAKNVLPFPNRKEDDNPEEVAYERSQDTLARPNHQNELEAS